MSKNPTFFRWGEFTDLKQNDTFAADPQGPLTGTLPNMFYDVPIIFGARQGFPVLNEVAMHNMVQVYRRLRLQKDASGKVAEVHRSFQMAVTNYFITESWNPYTNYPPVSGMNGTSFPRGLTLFITNSVRTWLTNNSSLNYTNFQVLGLPVATVPNIPAYTWKTNQFFIPGNAMTQSALGNSTYLPNGPGGPFKPAGAVVEFDTSGIPMTNQWGLTVNNRFLYLAFDEVHGQLVDAFASARMTDTMDITDALNNPIDENFPTAALEFSRLWSNRATNITDLTNFPSTLVLSEGERNQIRICAGRPAATDDVWKDYGAIQGFGSVSAAVINFNNWLATNTVVTNVQVTPFNSGARIAKATSWQANDPLVHYNSFDMNETKSDAPEHFSYSRKAPGYAQYSMLYRFKSSGAKANVTSISNLNTDVYFPWGRAANPSDEYKYNLKDAGVFNADLWSFPSHKYPTLGWIGRVHRGTPWETISLKSAPADVDFDVWRRHVGPPAARIETMTTNDWKMFDIFTTAIHPNVTRGRLSINQTNLAAWSAVFSGVVTTTNIDNGIGDGGFEGRDVAIQPDAIDPVTIRTIVNGINAVRQTFTNNQFHKLSEFLAVPQLTLESPVFAASGKGGLIVPTTKLLDSDYERLAEQILSLVKVGEPRFVVYAWGQSLKPAERGVELRNNAIYPAGPSIDTSTRLVKNYQITGETAMRAVVKVEFTYEYVPATQSVIRHPRAVIESFNIIPND